MLTQRIESVQPSPTLKITAIARGLKEQGKKVFNLAAGEPDFDTPPSVKAAAIKAIQDGFTKYTPTTGIPELKSAIAAMLSTTRGLSYRPQQIAVTCGAKQALYNILQALVEPGDEVLVPSPYWVSTPEMVRLAGAVPVEVRMDPKAGFLLDAKAVEKHCTVKTKCLVLNSPSNPTGAVLDEARLKDIAQVVRQKKLWVISDEIYSQLVYGVGHKSIATVSPDMLERTILVDGLSKAYSMTGWRIGYLAGPQEVVDATARLQDHSTSNPCSISQRAAVAALTGDQAPVHEMIREFAKRRDFLIGRLPKIPKISFVKPDGAFYCFVDISAAGMKSTPFIEKLLQEFQVAAIPGAGFGWDDHIRISFATGMADLQEGLDRLESFITGLR